jgi:hypothetical protein
MTAIGVDIAQGGSDQTVLAARHGAGVRRSRANPALHAGRVATLAGLPEELRRAYCDVGITW